MKRNKWKIFFFIIFGINIVVILTLGSLIMFPQAEAHDNQFEHTPELANNVNFDITTTKADLNKIINHYLNSQDFNDGFSYEIKLKDDVELHGTLTFFNKNIPLQLSFEPKALENGDLLLEQKEMKIGDLPLPVPFVLKFVNDNYKFPEWVKLNPKDQSIYVSLQTMKLKSNLRVRANQVDFAQDAIDFTLIVPTN